MPVVERSLTQACGLRGRCLGQAAPLPPLRAPRPPPPSLLPSSSENFSSGCGTCPTSASCPCRTSPAPQLEEVGSKPTDLGCPGGLCGAQWVRTHQMPPEVEKGTCSGHRSHPKPCSDPQRPAGAGGPRGRGLGPPHPLETWKGQGSLRRKRRMTATHRAPESWLLSAKHLP